MKLHQELMSAAKEHQTCVSDCCRTILPAYMYIMTMSIS